MPRNRSASSAVLGSFQRTAFSPRSRNALRRRVVLAVLATCSLVLITIQFRESPDGTLHDVQSLAASGLRPFQVAVERVARPFRDLYGYFDGLVAAKSENERLRIQIESLRQQLIENETAVQENRALRDQLDLRDVPPLRSYRRVNARVIDYPSSQYEQRVVIAAGSADGIRAHSPVRTKLGLVGEVTRVTSDTALVTLLTDETSFVSAMDLNTGVAGLVRHGQGDTLVLDRVPKDRVVWEGHTIVTSGSQVGELPSLYPKGIPIGVVTSVGQTDTDPFKQIQVTPLADFSDLYAVTVLVAKRPPPELP